MSAKEQLDYNFKGSEYLISDWWQIKDVLSSEKNKSSSAICHHHLLMCTKTGYTSEVRS